MRPNHVSELRFCNVDEQNCGLRQTNSETYLNVRSWILENQTQSKPHKIGTAENRAYVLLI